MVYITIISLLIVLIDQIIKIIIDSNVMLNHSIKLIPNFFNITYVKNFGAAFSILNGNRIFLILVAFITLFIVYIVFLKNKKINKLDIVVYGLLIGGIIGNLLDRIIRGYVVDYLDFNLFGYNFPIFNLADIVIVISTCLIIFIICRGEKNERNNN